MPLESPGAPSPPGGVPASRSNSLARGKPLLARASSGSSRSRISLTKDRERLARTLRASNLATSVLCGLTRDNALRRWSINVALSKTFDAVAACGTLANAVLLALLDPLQPADAPRNRAAAAAAPAFAVLYTLEAAVRVLALGGKGFLRDVWNVFDCLCIVAAWVAVIDELRPYVAALVLLRSLRALRVLPAMSVFLDSLLSTAAALRHVLMLTFLFASLFALLAVQVWGGTLGGVCAFTHPVSGDVVTLDTPLACALPCDQQSSALCRIVEGDDCPLIKLRVPSNPSALPVQSACVASAGPGASQPLSFDSFPRALITAFVMMTTEGFSDMTYNLWHAFGARGFTTLLVFSYVLTSSLVVLELALAVTFAEFRAAKEAEQRRLLAMYRRLLDFYALLSGGGGAGARLSAAGERGSVARGSGGARSSIGGVRASVSSMPRLSLESGGGGGGSVATLSLMLGGGGVGGGSGRNSLARASLRLSAELLTSVQAVRASRGLGPRGPSPLLSSPLTFEPGSGAFSGAAKEGAPSSSPSGSPPGAGGRPQGAFAAIPEEGSLEEEAGSSRSSGPAAGSGSDSGRAGGASTAGGMGATPRAPHRLPPLVSPTPLTPHAEPRTPLPPPGRPGLALPPGLQSSPPSMPLPSPAVPFSLQQIALRRASTRVMGASHAAGTASAAPPSASTTSPSSGSGEGGEDSFIVPAASAPPPAHRIPAAGSRLARYVSAGGGEGVPRLATHRSGAEWDARSGWRDSMTGAPTSGLLSPRSVRFGLSPAALHTLTKVVARRLESNAVLTFSPGDHHHTAATIPATPGTERFPSALPPAPAARLMSPTPTPGLFGRSRVAMSARHLARSLAVLETELKAVVAEENEGGVGESDEGGGGSYGHSRLAAPPLTAIAVRGSGGSPSSGSSPDRLSPSSHVGAAGALPQDWVKRATPVARTFALRPAAARCSRRCAAAAKAAFKACKRCPRTCATRCSTCGPSLASTAAAAYARVPSVPPRARAALYRLVTSRAYHLLQLVIIVGHAGVLGAWRAGLAAEEETPLRVASLACVAGMVVGLVLEVAALSVASFFRGEGGGFRSFDAGLTLLAAIDAAYELATPTSIGTAYSLANGMRVLRLLSCLRIIGCIPSLTTVATQLGSALPTAASLMLVFLGVVFFFGVLGLHLFGGRYGDGDLPRSNFNSLWASMVTSFQIVDGENFDSLVSAHVDAFGIGSAIFFIIAMLVGQILVLNVFIALFLHNFEETDTRGSEARPRGAPGGEASAAVAPPPWWRRAVSTVAAAVGKLTVGSSKVAPRVQPPVAVVEDAPSSTSGGSTQDAAAAASASASSSSSATTPAPEYHPVRPDVMWRVHRNGEPSSVTATIASVRAYPYEDELEGELAAGMDDAALQILMAARPLLRVRVDRLGDVHVHPFARSEYEARFGAVSGADVPRLAAAAATAAAAAAAVAAATGNSGRRPSDASRRGSFGISAIATTAASGSACLSDGTNGGAPLWDPDRGWVLPSALAANGGLLSKLGAGSRASTARGRRGSGASSAGSAGFVVTSGRFTARTSLRSPAQRRPSLTTQEAGEPAQGGGEGLPASGERSGGAASPSSFMLGSEPGSSSGPTRLEPIPQRLNEEEEDDDTEEEEGKKENPEDVPPPLLLSPRERRSARRSARLTALKVEAEQQPRPRPALEAPSPQQAPLAAHGRRLPPLALPATTPNDAGAPSASPATLPLSASPDASSSSLSATSQSTAPVTPGFSSPPNTGPSGRRPSLTAAMGASISVIAAKLPWSSRRGSFLGSPAAGPPDAAVDEATSQVFRSPDNRRSERVVWAASGRVRRLLSGSSLASLSTSFASSSRSVGTPGSGLSNNSLRTVSRWVRASARVSVGSRLSLRVSTFTSCKARLTRRWNAVRDAVSRFVYSAWFSRASLAVVLWSSVNLALDEPADAGGSVSSRAGNSGLAAYLSVSELIIACAFTLEVVLQVIARGVISHRRSYLRSPWRVVDLFTAGVQVAIVVLAAVSEGGDNDVPLRVLRAARALRSLRLISFFPGLRIVVNALAVSVPELLRLAGLLLVGVYTFAVVGLHTFAGRIRGCNDPSIDSEAACTGTFPLVGPLCAILPSSAQVDACRAAVTPPTFPRIWSSRASNFDNLGRALLTVLELVSGENWPSEWGPSDGTIRVDEPATPLYFILAELVLNMLLLEIIAGAIVETYRRLRDNARGLGWLSPQQRVWVANLRLIVLARPAIKLRPPTAVVGIAPAAPGSAAVASPPRLSLWRALRLRVFRLVVSPWFARAADGLSVLAFVHLALRAGWEDASAVATYETLNIVVVALMLLQLALEALGLGHAQLWSQLRSRWDALLCLLAIPSLVLPLGVSDLTNRDLARATAAIHTLQVLRATRLLQVLPGTRRVVEGLARAAPRILNVALVLGLNYFMWAIIAMNLFSGVKHSTPASVATMTTTGFLTPDANFDSFALSLVTIVRCSVGENAPGLLMYSTAPTPPYCTPGVNCGLGFGVSVAFFIAFFLVTTTVLLGLLSAVLIESFDAAGLHEVKSEAEGEGSGGSGLPGTATPGGAPGAAGSSGATFRLQRKHVTAFTAAWDRQDVDGEGALSLDAAARVVAALPPPLGTLVPPPPSNSSLSTAVLQAKRNAAAAASVTRAVRLVNRLPVVPDARRRISFHVLLHALVERACAAEPLAGELHAILALSGTAKSCGRVLRDVSAACRIQHAWKRFKKRVDACEAELLAEAGLAVGPVGAPVSTNAGSTTTTAMTTLPPLSPPPAALQL